MAQYKDYSKENDFPEGAVFDASKFHARIVSAPSITTSLSGISGNGDNVRVMFQAEPSAEEWATVDGLVSDWVDEMLAEAQERLKLVIRRYRDDVKAHAVDTWAEHEAEFDSAATAITNVAAASTIEDAETAADAYLGS